MSVTEPQPATPPRRRWLLLLPLAFFVALVVIFLMRLEFGGDPSEIPSALIGKPAPDFDLPPLDGTTLPGLKRADLMGKVTLVNIFGSWCVPCREEQPVLATLATDNRIRLVGIDYKDEPENARRFLDELGNPYAAIGVDGRGRAVIDWGGYGVPETFIVGKDGIIRYKFIGPISDAALEQVMKPEIEKALAGS